MDKQYELDHLDIKILRYLQVDARMTIKEIASKLNISTTPVFDRMKKMERVGLIKSYVALIDRKMIGKNLIVFIHISIKDHGKDAIDDFIDSIIKFPEVLECHHVSGDSDFLIKLVVEDIEMYNRFILDKLAVIPNVGKVESRFSLSERKMTTEIPISE